MYPCNHSNDAAYGGLAILVKDNMKHLELDSYRTQHIQASCIAIKYCSTLTTVAAIYSPPKHKVTDLLQHPGQRWVAGGDWNAKHENLGSRITSAKRRQLFVAFQSYAASVSNGLSTSWPVWPADKNELPDCIEQRLDTCQLRTMYQSHWNCAEPIRQLAQEQD